MILWIIILFAVLAAFLLRERSFYANWTTLFNTLISIYVSIMTAPYIIDLLPHGTKWPAYHCAGFVFLIGLFVFNVFEMTKSIQVASSSSITESIQKIWMITIGIKSRFSGMRQ